MDTTAFKRVVRSLLKHPGTTYADAAGIRAHYARCGESAATRLVDFAAAVRDDYDGDLRKLATNDVNATIRLLKQFKGIGDTGAKLAAALVRVSLDDDLRDRVTSRQ